MKKSHYNKINAVKCGLLTIMFLVLPLSLGTWEDIELNVLFIVLAVIMGYMTYKYGKKINEQGDTIDDYKPADNASEVVKIAFYKRIIYMSMLAFPVLTYFIIDDINSFENHSQEYLNLWWPVAYTYKYLGYWAGVLLIPVIGIICLLVFVIKIRKIKWEHNKNNNTLFKRY